METYLHLIDRENDPKQEWLKKLAPCKQFRKIDVDRGFGKKMIQGRWKKILKSNEKYKDQLRRRKTDPYLNNPDPHGFYCESPMEELMDERDFQRSEVFRDNIENFIGTVRVPLGIAGPLRVNGLHAQGDYYIPLATTEAALVASLARGISGINQSGGATAIVLREGVNRDPMFIFRTVIEALQFLQWATKEFSKFKEVAERMSRFGKLVDVKYLMDGSDVHMKCVYQSGDACGQNMVTICSEAIVEYIEQNSPIQPKRTLIEGGMSGDKKATHAVLHYVRGRRVVAECILKRDVAQSVFHATPEEMCYVGMKCLQSYFWNGTIGASAHFSNALTAISIALGQDPACASESHVGVGRIEVTENGDLYSVVTLPNLLVGTVGGGTKLPSQRACLELMGLYGSGKANALAEVVACVCLAGEMSLGSAITSGDFAKAHKILRGDRDPIDLENDTLDEAFIKAQAILVKLSEIPPKDVILKVYSLYKQSTIGDCDIDKPKLFSSLKVKAKYDSWKKLEGMDPQTAKKNYVDLVLNLAKEDESKVLEIKKDYLKKKEMMKKK